MPTSIDRSVTLGDLKKLNNIEIDCGRLGVVLEERHNVVSQCDLCKATGCLWFLAGDTASGFCDDCMLRLIRML